MADLSVHAVQWCAHHGHPVLALRTGDDRYFVVALSADDAAALASFPDRTETETPPRRLYRLIEATVRTLGARITEVQLDVGSDALLRATLRLSSPDGEFVLPANFADGVVLAYRAGLALRMTDEDLARIPLAPLFPVGPAPEPLTPPEAFRSLIESLDLEDLDGIRRYGGSHPSDQRG